MGRGLVQEVVHRGLAQRSRRQQDFVLHCVRALEKDNTVCAYQVLTHAYRALTEFPQPDVEAWIIQGLDVYDRSGLYGAVDVFKNVDKFLERAREFRAGAGIPGTVYLFSALPRT